MSDYIDRLRLERHFTGIRARLRTAIDAGQTSVREISERTGIPQSTIYSSLSAQDQGRQVSRHIDVHDRIYQALQQVTRA